ncbi:MAG: hypothetical protein LW884_06625 [Bacteroidetes bacterium]|jgi:aminopeptidase N|nr:hypothetical protein [Bacteroidota bacterium]
MPQICIKPSLYRFFYALSVLASYVAMHPMAQAQTPETRTHLYDPASHPRDHTIDVQHVRAELGFRPEAGQVYGQVWQTFRSLRPSLDTLWIDGEGIQISAALLDGQAVPYTQQPGGISLQFPKPITWDKPYTLQLDYACTPSDAGNAKNNIHFIGWNDPLQLKRKQIWAHDIQGWMPVYTGANDKFTTDLTVRFRKPYFVRCNGTPGRVVAHADGTRSFRYRMTKPMSSYLIMLAIGEYDGVVRKARNGKPHYLYYYPEYANRVEPTYRYSTQMMDWLEQELNVPYPWDSYGQIPIIDYMYGAMETTTCTVYGDFYQVDSIAYNDRSYVQTNCHELVHQWFGDYVTHLTFGDIWLTESFATYYAKKFIQQLQGPEAYELERIQELRSTLAAAEKDAQPVGSSLGNPARWYPKGSLVLDMLRDVVGDEPFRRSITRYLQAHPYGMVTSHDLYRAFEAELGWNLDWFFDQWVHRGGEPHYQINYTTAAHETEINIKQIQPVTELSGLFKMPIWLQVHYTNGTYDSLQLWVEKAEHTVRIPKKDKQELSFVLFDPGARVIKKLSFDRTPTELMAQALHAPLLRDRYDALRALDTVALAEKRPALIAAYRQATHWLPKAEVVRQLARDTEPDAQALLASALQAPHIQLRTYAALYLDSLQPELRPLYEHLLTDSSYFARAKALETLCKNYPEDADAYLATTQNMQGWRGRNIRIKWLKIRIGLRPETAQPYLDELKAYCTSSYEFETRINALDALRQLNQLPDDVIPLLYQACLHWNARLAGAAGAVLKHFYAQADTAAQLQAYESGQNWTPEQDAMLKPHRPEGQAEKK